MIFTVWNDVAPNGAVINSRVELLIPDDESEFSDLPWRAKTHVDWAPLSHSHHKTRAGASRAAEGAHASYLEVHSNYPEYQELRRAEEGRAS